MIARRMLAALVVLACMAATADQAEAQYLYGHPHGYGPYGHPFGSSLYSLGRIPVPPYHALHPPVYYSGITTTTYGSTPFARPPRLSDYPVHELPAPADVKPAIRIPVSPPTQSVKAKVVVNPHVQGEPTPARKAAPVRSAKVIRNPFVTLRAVSSTTN